MNAEPKNESREQEITESLDRALRGLLGIGRLWASHGLAVGRSALETSAQTLRTTAEMLGDISDRFAEKASESVKTEKAV